MMKIKSLQTGKMEEKPKCLQQMMLGKLDVHLQKNEIRPLSINFHEH